MAIKDYPICFMIVLLIKWKTDVLKLFLLICWYSLLRINCNCECYFNKISNCLLKSLDLFDDYPSDFMKVGFFNRLYPCVALWLILVNDLFRRTRAVYNLQQKRAIYSLIAFWHDFYKHNIIFHLNWIFINNAIEALLVMLLRKKMQYIVSFPLL